MPKVAKKATGAAKPRAKKTVDATAKPKPKPKPKATMSKKRPKPDSDDEDSASEHRSTHDDSLLLNTPPSAKKQKKIPVARKRAAGSEPLQDLVNEALTLDGATDPKTKKSQSATDQYQKVCYARARSNVDRSLAHNFCPSKKPSLPSVRFLTY